MTQFQHNYYLFHKIVILYELWRKSKVKCREIKKFRFNVALNKNCIKQHKHGLKEVFLQTCAHYLTRNKFETNFQIVIIIEVKHKSCLRN
jgi:hypothetical protein